VRDKWVIAVFAIGVLAAAVAIGVLGWRVHGPYGDINSTVWRSVDPATGQSVISFSSKGHGTPDIWCFMDGTRLVRMEFDESHDGVIDRWEYYDSNGRVERAYQLNASGERAMVAMSPAPNDTRDKED
jgi:hypothetical protein